MRVWGEKVVPRASGSLWKGWAFRCCGEGTEGSLGWVRIVVVVVVVALRRWSWWLGTGRGMPVPQCPSQSMSHFVGSP
jgi:hypothetical protein